MSRASHGTIYGPVCAALPWLGLSARGQCGASGERARQGALHCPVINTAQTDMFLPLDTQDTHGFTLWRPCGLTCKGPQSFPGQGLAGDIGTGPGANLFAILSALKQ